MKKNNNMAMMVVMCMVIVVAFTVAAIMFAKGRSSGDEEDFVGSLPEKYVGSWELPGDSHVLQSPRTAELTEDEALADENDFGVTMTYGVYSTTRVGSVANPSYKMQQNCGTDAMDEQEMQSDGIMDEFSDNASITKIEVFSEDGNALIDTVFIIDDEYLVYYGRGNYVFCAVKLDAVG